MIRYLEQEEKKKIIPLYTMCFDDTKEYCDYYFEKRLPENEVAVYEENGQIKGMIHLIAKNVVCGNEMETPSYLYAVATNPAFRKQGVMGQILCKVLQDLQAKGDGFTYLIPSSEENAQIYQKYGFARVMDKFAFETIWDDENILTNITRRYLQNSESESGVELYSEGLISIKKACSEDIEDLSNFAQNIMAHRYAVYISKNREYFQKMMELMEADDGEILLYLVDCKIKGYRIGNIDEVLEEVWDTDLLPKCTKIPYVMARILNIPKVLASITTNDYGHIYIEVIDSIIEDNNGVFLWEFSPEGHRWKKSSHEADWKVTIEEFTAYLFGYNIGNLRGFKKNGNIVMEEYLLKKFPSLNTKQGFFINDYV